MPATCSACQVNIKGNPMTLSGMNYHPECFVCHKCRGSLKGKACHTHEGYLYDQDCYAAYCASKCNVCHIPITGNHVKFIKVGDKTFHTECYVCHSCKKSLQGKGCQTYEGKMFDPNCFAAFCAARCDACFKPIKGNNIKFVRVGNRSFHTKCYVCKVCHKTLQGVQYFTAENNMRVCVPCLTT